MAKVYLGLGTNLGDKEQNLRNAIQQIEERIGRVISLSAFYVTTPWGFDSDNSFLNAAICVETSFSPISVLHETKEIELQMGRTHKSVNGIYSDRLIDIDLLLYDDLLLNTDDLLLPHPLMTQRLFVMEPLVEIAPDLLHPFLHKTMKTLLQLLSFSKK